MIGKLKIVNSLTREKEEFKPLNPPYVGMYVCGPTVYSDVHLGNVRTFICFDVMYRYLQFIGYKVRYVRNLTDVGHLLDNGEDKISKKATLENLEPMEVVQKYTNDFHAVMDTFNALRPSIEPSATGHMVEQLQMIEGLMEKGMAYESNGSIYFDISAYEQQYQYGKLSNRKTEDMLNQTRELDGQSDKRNPLDFALWKKANPDHIMRWPTKWSEGFPGWHLECSVMSTKYLGKTFDIHGGGMDLKFPHHECEIAQNQGALGEEGARYWVHTNMLTVNGQKMSKSLNNSFLPRELFTGDHDLLERGYSPMTVRFFILQSHYASTVDFSNEALASAQKGYMKLANGLRLVKGMKWPADSLGDVDEKQAAQINKLCDNCYYAMNDDFNTALCIGHLFNIVKKINAINAGQLDITHLGKDTFERMKKTFVSFSEDVLGLHVENNTDTYALIDVLLKEYGMAKESKDYDTVDRLRADLKGLGIIVKDMKGKIDWAFEE